MKKVKSILLLLAAMLLAVMIMPQKALAVTPYAVNPSNEVHVSTAAEFKSAIQGTIPVAGKVIVLDKDISGVSQCKISSEGTLVLDLNGYSINMTGAYGFAIGGAVDFYIINSKSNVPSGKTVMDDVSFITYTATASPSTAANRLSSNWVHGNAMFIMFNNNASLSIYSQAVYTGDEVTKRMTPQRGIRLQCNSGSSDASTYYPNFIELPATNTSGTAKSITISGAYVSVPNGTSNGKAVISIATNYDSDVKVKIANSAYLSGLYIIDGTTFGDYISNVKIGECTLDASSYVFNSNDSNRASSTDKIYNHLWSSSDNSAWGFVDSSGTINTFNAATTVLTRNMYKKYIIRADYSKTTVGTQNVVCYTTRGHITETYKTYDFELVKHTYKTTVTEPTCTATGYTKKECTKCQYTITSNPTNMKPHEYTEILVAAKPATCTEKGNTATVKCAHCTAVQVGVEIAATGHVWNAGVITTPATVVAAGVKTFTCTKCTTTKTEVIPKLTAPAAGAVITPATGESYTVVKPAGAGAEVEYTAPASGALGVDIVVPNTIISSGVEYKVTSIAAKAFKNNVVIRSIKLGDNILTIGKEAFYGCKNLKKVTLNANLKTISDKAFYKCTSLTSIKITKNVSKIGKSAFEKCSKLKTVTISTTKLSKSKVGTAAFKSINAKAVVKVPKSKLSAYKTMLKARGITGKSQVIKKA